MIKIHRLRLANQKLQFESLSHHILLVHPFPLALPFGMTLCGWRVLQAACCQTQTEFLYAIFRFKLK